MRCDRASALCVLSGQLALRNSVRGCVLFWGLHILRAFLVLT